MNQPDNLFNHGIDGSQAAFLCFQPRKFTQKKREQKGKSVFAFRIVTPGDRDDLLHILTDFWIMLTVEKAGTGKKAGKLPKDPLQMGIDGYISFQHR